MFFYPFNLLHKTEEIPLFSSNYFDFLQLIYKFRSKDNADFNIYEIPYYEDNIVLQIKNYWDLIDLIPIFIKYYIDIFSPKSVNYSYKNLHKIGNNNIFLEKDITFEGNIVLNALKGPIIIDENVQLRNFTSIEGPAYIGRNSVLDNATIRGPFICGQTNKLSGEIESSFFMDFVNKHHYGFIGHSIIENWVNLGAGTTNSDLKNNYSFIKIFNGNKFVNTRKIKLGCIIGEHTKTAIGTMINTGTVIGPFCNIFEKPQSKHIPSFSWGEDQKYDIDKLIRTIRKVMRRRDVVLKKDYINRIKELYNNYS